MPSPNGFHVRLTDDEFAQLDRIRTAWKRRSYADAIRFAISYVEEITPAPVRLPKKSEEKLSAGG